MQQQSELKGATQPRVLDVAVLIFLSAYGVMGSFGGFAQLNRDASVGAAIAATAGLGMVVCALLVWRRRSASHWSGWVGLGLALLGSASRSPVAPRLTRTAPSVRPD